MMTSNTDIVRLQTETYPFLKLPIYRHSFLIWCMSRQFLHEAEYIENFDNAWSKFKINISIIPCFVELHRNQRNYMQQRSVWLKYKTEYTTCSTSHSKIVWSKRYNSEQYWRTIEVRLYRGYGHVSYVNTCTSQVKFSYSVLCCTI